MTQAEFTVRWWMDGSRLHLWDWWLTDEEAKVIGERKSDEHAR